MQDLLKIVKSLEDSGILLDGITETVKNEVKEQKGDFLSMLFGTLGASLLGDLLTKNLSGRGVIRAGEGTIRAGYGSKKFSLLTHQQTLRYRPIIKINLDSLVSIVAIIYLIK